ncbi:hypothetical protein [Candidatus Protofrankia californiensis]|nr:hypothetical protein [Candidatus Protofrankia californiensis]
MRAAKPPPAQRGIRSGRQAGRWTSWALADLHGDELDMYASDVRERT